MKVKQVIVMRTDLNMRKGKMIAQGAHASIGALLLAFTKEFVTNSNDVSYYRYCAEFSENSALDEWLNGAFTKICVGVNSETALLEIYDKANDANLPVKLITDSGLTEFHNVPTHTCLAIGPFYSDKIDEITGNLKLL